MLEAIEVTHVFDVSRPALQRLLAREQRQVLRAVDAVSFAIPRGTTLSLVGESGCGKSTVARLAVGLYTPSEGEIRFEGQPLSAARAQPDLRRRMNMIFQDPYASLNPRWRVRDIIAEPIRTFGIVRTAADLRDRVGALLSQVGLAPADGDKYPHEFSGGQRQRVSIARALSSEPEFLVCDEPSSALDVSVQAQILNLMRDLQTRLGLTYLFISHNLAVVRHMSDRLGVMYLGRIVELGPAEEIFHAPRHPYTRLLLDAIPDLENPGRSRTPVGGEVPSPIAPPPGCTFHPRCPLANARCRVEKPVHTQAGDTLVACHAVEEGRSTP
jgi:peptide/nickel transport system ATP-binding protein